MIQLEVRDDLCEIVSYTSSHLPIRSSVARLSHFLGYAANCHWHRDLEFTIIHEGEMTYHVNGNSFPLARGDCIFVNANRLHFGGPAPHGPVECIFHCLVIHPSLLCANPYIEGRFVNPLLYDTRYDALVFSASASAGAAGLKTGWRVEALSRIGALAELTLQSPDDSALEVQSRLYELWSLLLDNTVTADGDAAITAPREDGTLKRMLSFIQMHYSEKIGLEDIAKAGVVCRSKCCLLFKRVFHQTVFEYLLHFRVRRSLRLLSDESLSLTDVAAACGFSQSSYYGEIFKRITGISPGKYRRKFRAGEGLPRM